MVVIQRNSGPGVQSSGLAVEGLGPDLFLDNTLGACRDLAKTLPVASLLNILPVQCVGLRV